MTRTELAAIWPPTAALRARLDTSRKVPSRRSATSAAIARITN